MIEDIINFGLEHAQSSIIKVLGVGGGGCNAVNHMIKEGIQGVDFLICNTDAQAMRDSPAPIKIQLGVTLTEGRGAGNQPEHGEQAAIENMDDIRHVLEGSTKMIFVTAGMGGGTGTGAAPVIAKLAREMGILTIAVVSVPAPAEGKRRFNQAMEGLEKLRLQVDSMLVISNEKLHQIYGDLPASQAFKKADDIITTAVKGMAEIITVHGNINIDFADVNTVMAGSEVFIMGTGIARGEERAMQAVHEALESPLLDSNDINGTKDILLNIISGNDEITMGEIGNIIEYLQKEAGEGANIIWGNGIDEQLEDQISVTIIATRFNKNPSHLLQSGPGVEEFVLDASLQPEINLDDGQEPIFENFPDDGFSAGNTENTSQKRTSIKSSRKSKRKNEPVVEEKEDSRSTESWFLRQFNRLFDDQENTENN